MEVCSAPWRGWRSWRWIQTPLILVLGGTLAYDRYLLCQQYLFKYTDEDQALMWYAAHELLHGRLHEPCFYGQDYNSCMEGWLSAPLVALHIPYHVAVPLVSLILGLLPFLVLAYLAWRRGQSLVSAACLLVPLMMPVRYGIMVGMPRGFVTGLALASIPMALLLPPGQRPRRATQGGEEPVPAEGRRPGWLTRSRPALRYFCAGLWALLAIQINPNCLVLLIPVALYAILTTWREWKFWIFGTAGLLAALPYLIYVDQFYHVYHPDYVAYLRGVSYAWSSNDFNIFLHRYVAPQLGGEWRPSLIFADLVPAPVDAAVAPYFIVGAFAVVGLLLLLRRRVAALLAGLAGVVFTFLTFAYQRVVTIGDNSVSFPYARMYIAVPVLLLWLLMLVNHRPWARCANAPPARWLTRGMLAGLVAAGVVSFQQKQEAFAGIVAQELRDSHICPQVPVEEVYATAHEVQRLADLHKADLLIVGGADKHWAYLMPELTTIDTLYATPMLFERRTWRWIEESTARHNNVLAIGFGGTRVGGGPMIVDADGAPVEEADGSAGGAPVAGSRGRGAGGPGGRGGGRAGGRGRAGGTAVVADVRGNYRVNVPIINMLSAGGKSVFSLPIPLPRVVTPAPTPANPHPMPQMQRQPWPLR